VLSQAQVDANGRLSVHFKVPEDYGGVHEVMVSDDGVTLAQGGIEVGQTFEIRPTEGPVGTLIELRVKGLGWRTLDSTWVVNWDNHEIGWVSAADTRGTAIARFRATGPAGDHPIIVFGASLGTTTALHIAAHRPVAGLILHNPPPIREMILRQFGWWNLWLLAGPLSRKVPADLDSIANARAVHVPAVFLLAEEDEVVAPRFQHLVVDAYAGEKRLISLAGANHNSPLEGTGLRRFYEALDWLLPKDLD